MKTITISERSKERLYHIEAPGCIVNIYTHLLDFRGRNATSINVIPDNHYAGVPAWNLPDLGYADSANIRVVQCEKPVHEPAGRTRKINYLKLQDILMPGPEKGFHVLTQNTHALTGDMEFTDISYESVKRIMRLAANPEFAFDVGPSLGGGHVFVVRRKEDQASEEI